MSDFRARMAESSEARKSRVVLALDLSGPVDDRVRRASAVLDRVKGGIAAVKLNHHLLLPFGLKGVGPILEACRAEKIPLIADLKLNDIESTNLNAVDSLFSAGFDAVIANPFVGFKEGLEGVFTQAHSLGRGVILLVYMSHAGAAEGYGLRDASGEPIYRLFARRAKDWRADGVVVSAKSGDVIREVRNVVGDEMLIFTPGVGTQGGSSASAAAAGADYQIVGRSITEAGDPAEALKTLLGR
jgi:orotidine-5'-phosphate decarboxylase